MDNKNKHSFFNGIQPKTKERILQIDALRGFALFGILIVNIFVFHVPYPHYGDFYFSFEGLNRVIVEQMIFLFAGKFMFIYAFLFGYSFWIQYEKAKDMIKFSKYWNKRMILLAFFGMLHVLLFSYGDILLPYALLGLSLPFFARYNNRILFLLFILISLIPVYEFVLRGFIDFPSVFMKANESLESYIAINGQGSFIEVFKLRMRDYFSFTNEKVIMYIPKELSLFIFGIIASRKKLAEGLSKSKTIGFLLIAIFCISSMYFFRPQIIGYFDIETSVVQRIILGLFIHFTEFLHGLLYIICFLTLWKINFFQKLMQPLIYTGRLSLSNYIMQSMICVFIFWGLGYYGLWTPMRLVICAICIYAFQLLYSFYWLQKKTHGPLEFIWRKYSK